MAENSNKKLNNFAIIETGGNQYKVEEGDFIDIEKVEGEEGDEISFDKVLLISDEGDIKVGKPYIKGSKVSGEIRKQGREKKKIVFRYKPKKRQRTKKGHRQPFTRVEIKSIG